jgi:predicted transcriptional regulator
VAWPLGSGAELRITGCLTCLELSFPDPGIAMPNSPQLKQRILAAVDDLPADATIEDAIERLVFVAQVERGLAQAEAGQLIPHEEIVKRFSR